MDFKIVNIKALLRIPTTRIDAVVDKLRNSSSIKNYTLLHNFISIHVEGRLRFVLFEKSRKSPAHVQDQACNVTGVRSFKELRSAITKLATLLGKPRHKIRFKVNNITVLWTVPKARGSAHTLLCLTHLGKELSAKGVQWKYTPEMHSGLVAKSGNGCTAMIYRTLKVVFVGAHNYSIIEDFAKLLEPLICASTITSFTTTKPTEEFAEIAEQSCQQQLPQATKMTKDVAMIAP